MRDRKARFCLLCGAPTEERLLYGKSRAQCTSCGWIYFEDPKVAAGVYIEQNNQVLLVERNNEPSRGLWSIPAGFVDAYEDPADAARRECLEETGLVVRITGLIDVISGREHRSGADIFIIYRAEIIEGMLAPGDDASQAQFFNRNDLPPLAFRATRKVLGVE